MISFSANVKRELCRTAPGAKCCALAEMLGALLYANHFSASCIRIVTENPEFAARLPRLLQRGFGLRFDALPEPEAQGKRVLVLEDTEKISHVFTLCGFSAESSLALHVNLALLENDCCRRAFLRGAFLAGGSVTDPAKRYHLEFSTSHRRVCAETGTLLLEMGLTPKQTERKGSSILYFKQSETIEELLARIRAALRKRPAQAAEPPRSLLTAGPLTMDTDRHEVSVNGEGVELTRREFDLLRYLLENKERVISRESLLDHVWGFDFVGETNAVDVYIRFLRAKIDEHFGIKLIHTVRGVGYVIREEGQ